MPLPASRGKEFIRRPRATARSPPERAASVHRGRATESFSIHPSLQVGKYLVSPLTRSTHCGRYAASVSIRTGRGSATHDRVLRFHPIFDSRDAAVRYATAQGLAWIGAPTSRIAPSSPTRE